MRPAELVTIALGAAWLGAGGEVRAANSASACQLLTYKFQPDCFRAPADTSCRFDPTHPDLGPQIAVWIGSADGTEFVDTLMVTNAVAVHGIGNRPGSWNLRSGPRFPYGRRQMALPIWAHARGQLYPLVAMNDGFEDHLVGHEETSSPEPYFCRPMLENEIVDAITCPSGLFRSAKGLLDAAEPPSYYPPRADLYDFGGTPCLPRPGYPGSCDPGDSAQYFALNDVDLVAAATPPYGAPFTGSWIVPSDLAAGDYVLDVEVGKEFDGDAADQYPSDPNVDLGYADYGQTGNIGQPSVLFQVPFELGPGAIGTTASAATFAGYGDWSGASGAVSPPDATIADQPGSGQGRLLSFDAVAGGAAGGSLARVSLAISACPPVDCTSNAVPVPVAFTASPTADGAGVVLDVTESGEGGQPVLGYETRYAITGQLTPIDPAAFSGWTAAGAIAPGPPNTTTSLEIDGLTPDTSYAVGIVAKGVCGSSAPTYQRFYTPPQKFTQLSGCFIATAAFGSDLAPSVRVLRALRDAATARSTLASVATDLYYRSSPPLAAALRGSLAARALLRTALRIFAPPE